MVIVTAPSSAFVPLPMCNKESGESSPIPIFPSDVMDSRLLLPFVLKSICDASWVCIENVPVPL